MTKLWTIELLSRQGGTSQFSLLFSPMPPVNSMQGLYLLTNSYSGNQLLKVERKKVINIKTYPSIYGGINQLQKTGYSFSLEAGEDLMHALKSKGRSWFGISSQGNDVLELIKLEAIPGKYYPKIFRPILHETKNPDPFNSYGAYIAEGISPSEIPFDDKMFRLSLNQLAIIKDMLASILNNVYPCAKHKNVYSHTLKNLLFVACTEVEAQLKGILLSNRSDSKDRFNTKDYVKLKDALRLEEYSLRLSYYPDLQLFSPFRGWNAHKSTESLKWYDSYNQVKHNSYGKFKLATLENAISAVTAVAVLLLAQYGNHLALCQEGSGSFFQIVNAPDWKVEEHYLPPYSNRNWKKVKHVF